MHWRPTIRTKFYILFAAIIFGLLSGIAIGQYTFARVQVGGDLYKGIQLKKDALFAVNSVRTNINLLRGDLFEQSFAKNDYSKEIESVPVATDALFRQILEMKTGMKNKDRVFCSDCHTAESLSAVYSPVDKAFADWQKFQKGMRERILPLSKTAQNAAIISTFETELAGIFRDLMENLDEAEKLLEAVAPQQVSYILGQANKIRLGFIIGGLVMTGFLMGAAVYLLQQTTQQIARESEEISASTKSLSRSFREQQAKVQEIVDAITNMSQSIERVAQNTSDALAATEEASEVATYGRDTSGYTIDSVKKGAGGVREAADIVGALGSKSKDIGNIITVIDNIAMQTNILALNAAVEAARAGEHGRGFDVVANEVRNLAKRTSTATAEIGKLIQFIQTETDLSVTTITKSREQVERGVKLIDAVSQSFNSIVIASAKATDMVRNINEIAREQARTAEQLTKEMQDMAIIQKNTIDVALHMKDVSKSTL